MLYDLSNPLQLNNFIARCEVLKKKSCIVELKEKKPIRTLAQNKYLHVCLGYFGALTGYTIEHVKEQYFKKLVNPEIFVREIDDKFLGKAKILRSSASLDSAEMTTAIERFRDWAVQTAGIYIPSVKERDLIIQMEIDIERNKTYL